MKAFLDSLWQTEPFGKLILLVLLFLSIACWAITFNRWRVYKRAQRQSQEFLEMFEEKGGDFSGIHASVPDYPHSYHAATFAACYRELRALAKVENKTLHFGREIIPAVENAMSRTMADQLLNLQHYLFYLATTTGLAPFLGLLGTVWGIMAVFMDMAVGGAGDLGRIAPGISTALTTTIVGLIVAIPALVAYNYFQRYNEIIITDMENFAKRLSSILEKNAAVNQSVTQEWKTGRSVGAI